jgi:YebC/PmpR family DNA-binding regulatory protein
MAGHSKWAKIKRAKAANDKQKSKIFTKLGKQITIAASEGGGDPDMNFTLRLAIDKANQANMPKDNIERAIKRGTGELSEGQIERITYEAVVGDGIGILIDCSTDNTNRTYSEVRNIVETKGAKMASAGAVSWGFNEMGRIEVGIAKLEKSEKYGVDDKYVNAEVEEFELELIEIPGIQDYKVFHGSENQEFLEVASDDDDESRPENRHYAFVITEKESLQAVAEALDKAGWQLLDTEIMKSADNPMEVGDSERSKVESLVEELEDNDDVDTVWTVLA